MITEDYVSFETAKLLQNKGFDLPNSPFSCQQERDAWIQDNSYSIPNHDYDEALPFDSQNMTVIAPHVTQSLVMKWLREKHNLCIEPYRTACGYLCTVSKIPTGCQIYSQQFEGDDWNSGQFTTFEKAVAAAIKYCLTKLI